MNYIQVINLIFLIISLMLGLLMVHFAIFAIVGLFAKKTYPKTDTYNKYGVIIPARNEESVIAGLIESIQKNRYPQDKLQIFVIAHNCTDQTAEIARKMGVTVYEYNNPEECTMGYAFQHLFSCIERDYGTQNYDGFFLFNADNILDSNYFARMNDAFEYYDKQYVITSFRNSKNFGTNLISGLYGLYFAAGCRMESRGRTVTGCSTRVQGTGYVINSNVVKDGWHYVTLTEDWEFSADQILLNNMIRYCDDAVFYDEQPTSFKIMWRQRVRWSRGHLLVFYARIKDLLKSIFVGGEKHRHKGSLYDIMINILPASLFGLALMMVQSLFLLATPLVDPSLTLKDAFIGHSWNLLTCDGVLLMWLRSFILSGLGAMCLAVIVLFAERKRIKNVSFGHKVLIVLAWPLFIALSIPMEIQALFSRNLGWKPIPHKDSTTFAAINDMEMETDLIAK